MDEMRSIDVAYYLGVSKQRVSQLASEQGFPQPRHLLDGTRAGERTWSCAGPSGAGGVRSRGESGHAPDLILTSVYTSGSPCCAASRCAQEASFLRSTHKEPCRRIERVVGRLFEGEEAVLHVTG